MSEINTETVTRELREAMDGVAALMATPQRQEQAIELWEKLWTEAVPDVAQKAGQLATAVAELERPMTEDELAEIAPLLGEVAKMLKSVTSDKAPNPDLIALYYLRRIDKRTESFEERLSEIEGMV